MHNGNRRYTSCPDGMQWYVCSTNKFSGCCLIDPCDKETCPTTASKATVQISSHSYVTHFSTSTSVQRLLPTAESEPRRTEPHPGNTTGLPVLAAIGVALGALFIGKILGILIWITFNKYLRVRSVRRLDLAASGARTILQGR